MMKYKQLRQRYIDYLSVTTECRDLKSRVRNGELSSARLTACESEIARLSKEIDDYEAFFTHLEKIGDPVWIKMAKELDMEFENDNPSPISFWQIMKKFIGTVSMLIIGMWVIDRLRRK